MSEVSTLEAPVTATGEIIILDKTGDTRLQWSRDNPDEVAYAKKRFEELKNQGFMAYTVNKKGKQGEVIHTFDPTVDQIILTPPMAGG